MTTGRIGNLRAVMNERHLDAIAVMPGANMRYLTGLVFHPGERLTLAIFSADEQPPCLVLPTMELSRARRTIAVPQPDAGETPLAVEFFPWSDDEGPMQALLQAVEFAGGKAAPGFVPVVGVEYGAMRVMELRALEQAGTFHYGELEIRDATPLLSSLRMVKEPQERAAMAEAARIVEVALRRVIAEIRPGVTERQLAARWATEMLAAGAEGESFASIIASGPNSADPHHVNSDRPFQPGDLIVLDGGALYGGYASDITRTVALGEPSTEARRIYEVVLQANSAARAAVRPQVTGEQLDQVARAVIEKSGYGDYFVHRTGHGLGLECHEPPYIVAGSVEPLPVGTTFTIEPGIYVEGIGGVRIEDDVLVTEEGGTSLTTFERDLIILPV